MIDAIDAQKPDGAKIAATAQDFDGKFPPEDLTLSLAPAADPWADVAQLGELVRRRQGWTPAADPES